MTDHRPGDIEFSLDHARVVPGGRMSASSEFVTSVIQALIRDVGSPISEKMMADSDGDIMLDRAVFVATYWFAESTLALCEDMLDLGMASHSLIDLIVKNFAVMPEAAGWNADDRKRLAKIRARSKRAVARANEYFRLGGMAEVETDL